MATSLITLYHQAEDCFFRAIAKNVLEASNDVTAYMTGVPVADLNLIYVRQNASVIENIDNIIDQCKHWYNKENLDFVLIIPEELCLHQEMADILKNKNYLQTAKSVTMMIEMGAGNHTSIHSMDSHTELNIQQNNNNLKDWMLPLIGAFESTFENCLSYAKVHENALEKQFALHHFSLYKQGKPISSITLSIHDNIARIDDVGTLPEFQGKGYATYLVKHALLEAQKLGAKYCFLEASDSGFSIYQKIGFKPLFKNNIYSYSKPV